MILLDTHVLIWWVSDPGRLSERARNSIEQERQVDGGLLVSCITTWEISLLVSRSRLALRISAEDYIRELDRIDAIRFVPITNNIALQSNNLPSLLHRDPADRMIIATARGFGCPLVTYDEKIRNYPHVETIW